MTKRETWSEAKRRRLDDPAGRTGYESARAAYDLGRRVRDLRETQGISQRELADRMGTTQSVIARLEGGGSRPSLSTLERVAEAVGMVVDVQFREPAAAS